ncbi:unnamed protein product [Cylindrotheca closterium]|uniref:BUD13 homolog n=1 Tax=Cylindrotheca closterium TaxID=2856 RepID=A0AAD2FH84_9STRA|nr:unnamed protein product [Cylindrotheca closterium]
MSSKLDYLSKYISSEQDSKSKKKSKKKKKKTKQSSDYEEPPKLPVKETSVYDEDDAIQFPKGDLAEDDDDDDIMAIPEEDRPTIVSSQDLGAHGDLLLPKVRVQSRGSWKTTTATGASTSNNNIHGDADNVNADPHPSRRRRYDSSDDESNQRRRPKRRHDSEDENKKPTIDNRSASPPQRRRYDSEEDGPEAKPEDTHRPRRRYDSDDESDGKNGKPDEAMRKPRRRYDSEDDDEDPKPIKEPPKEEDTGGGDMRRSRRRYDSSEDEKDDNKKESSSPQHHHRYDSEEEGSSGRRKRRRFDVEVNNDETKPPKEKSPEAHPDVAKSDGNARSRRYDSEDDDEGENSNDNGGRRQRRQRYDSSDDDDDDNVDKDKKGRMSSGHKAGLQNYKDFNSAEKVIQQRKQNDAQVMVDKYGMGETVYRDAKGRRTTNTETPGQSVEQQEQIKNLNEGKLQRLERERKAQEMVNLQNSTFARHETDHRLEDMRKNEIRKGDPMAAYALKNDSKKKKKKKKSSSKRGNDANMEEDEKPTYKGPPPRPNRFGIRPGYRWDGVDRGNGWEDKLLAKQYMAKTKQEEAYRWRSADM